MDASDPAMTATAPNPARGRPPFERIALVLQGGGALGAYQAGVYEALAEADLHPDWVAGISIGAINSSIISGNPPERRVDRLRAFWEEISRSPVGIPNFHVALNQISHQMVNQMRAANILMFGAPGFFTPRFPPPLAPLTSDLGSLSFYDVSPVRQLLGELVDFDYINAGGPRMSVGAVNVQSGNFIYFDTETHTIDVNHVLASGSLPPGFPATEVDGEYYWDGGILSNTPLDWILESDERKDTLTFQVDLWSAEGALPRNLIEADLRQKEIRFSSRTRLATDHFRRNQQARRAMWKLLQELPPELKEKDHTKILAERADEKVYSIIELIYRSQAYEGGSKDYEFSRRTMEEHWAAGYRDTVATLRHDEVLERPRSADGFFTFDLNRDGRL